MDLIHHAVLDRRALSRLSHHPRSFLTTERDSLDSFFLFSNFARQRVRLCKDVHEWRVRKAVARREATSVASDGLAIWYDFYLRLGDLLDWQIEVSVTVISRTNRYDLRSAGSSRSKMIPLRSSRLVSARGCFWTGCLLSNHCAQILACWHIYNYTNI